MEGARFSSPLTEALSKVPQLIISFLLVGFCRGGMEMVRYTRNYGLIRILLEWVKVWVGDMERNRIFGIPMHPDPDQNQMGQTLGELDCGSVPSWP